MNTKSVFISYAHEDHPRVSLLTQSMESADINFWIDRKKLIAGHEYNNEIAKAIEQCDIFLLILTNHSALSPYVSEELNLARSLKKRLYVLQLEDIEESKISGGVKLLRASYHIDIVYDQPLSETAKKLIASLNRHFTGDEFQDDNQRSALAEENSVADGINHYLRLEWEKAYQIFEQNRQKSPEALFYLGEMHFLGRHIKRDLGVARKFYMEAISKGESRAKAGLAFIYDELDEFSEQRSQLFKDGFEALWEATLNGDTYSANYLAILYDKGKGVTQSNDKAVKYFKQAATQGYVVAQSNLGNIYEEASLGVVRDYDEARKWYTFAAENGSSVAQYRLGRLYEEGLGVESDLEKAVYWYQEAAKASLADSWSALRQLGILYHSGKGGLPQDYDKALSLLEQAANQGDTIALTWIGLMYEMGDGVKQDFGKALKCYKDANFKSPDYAFAQMCLGDVYFHGRGVEKDINTATEWYKKARKNGNAEAGYLLGTIYEQGLNGSKNIQLAIDYYIQAAERGIDDATYKLGTIYEEGQYVAKNTDKALYWYSMGASKGHLESMYRCGQINRATKNYSVALSWFHKAAVNNHSLACYWYGYMVELGLGVKKDYAISASWYEAAAEANYTPAMNRLGLFYLYGLGVKKDEKKALELLSESYDQGDTAAAYHLGYMHENGVGVQQDYSEAISFYEKAAGDGNADAQLQLAWMYMNGLGVEQNLSEAAAYYSDVIEGATLSTKALCYLGCLYEWGYGVPKNTKYAQEYYFKAFNEDDQLAIAILYEKGWGVNRNYETAINYYRAECEKGDPLAQYRLAQLLIYLSANDEETTESIFTTIVYWLRKSAASNFWLAVEALNVLDKAKEQE